MTDRLHVPFDDAWSMQIEPRVSQAVRIGGFGATCGQCDLDGSGKPRNEDELWSQVEAVCGHLRRRLDQADARADDVRRLEAFYVGPVDEHELADALRAGVGSDPDVLLVPLPCFYYPGMRIELDAIFDRSERLVFRTGDGEDVESALDALGIAPESLVALRIYYTSDAVPARMGSAASTTVPLPALPSKVRVSAVAAEHPPAGLVFVAGEAPVDARGTVLHPWDVESQTRLVKERVGRALERAGSSLADLVKVTVHYLGGPRPEDLHRNLEIRSRFYAPPGPASTGVPVPRLEPDGTTILVEAVAAKRDG